MADAEVGSSFDTPAIPSIPKTSSSKLKKYQEFNLYITTANTYSTYKFKAYTCSNRSPEDVLEWEKKMQKLITCKLVDMVEGKFDLVE
eukprot:9570454-Ditylum_brightwellii.AAC.1